MHKKKGQSVLEYVIVLTAIVAAVLIGASLFANRTSSTSGVGKLMNKTGGAIEKAATDIAAIRVN